MIKKNHTFVNVEIYLSKIWKFSTLHVIYFRFYLTKLDQNLSSVNSFFKVSIYVLIIEKGNLSIYKDKDTA